MNNIEPKCKKTTENERAKNAAKGCVRPADGTPKRCIVKVVSCNKGDITRRDESDDVTITFCSISKRVLFDT